MSEAVTSSVFRVFSPQSGLTQSRCAGSHGSYGKSDHLHSQPAGSSERPAVTFVDWDALPRWGLISKALELDLANPPETYHTSDHLYTDLGIPTDVTGRLPRAKRTRKGLDAEELEDLGGSDRPKGGKSKDDRGKKSGGGKGKGNRSRGSSSKNQSENATPGDDKPRKPRKRTRRRVNKPE